LPLGVGGGEFAPELRVLCLRFDRAGAQNLTSLTIEEAVDALPYFGTLLAQFIVAKDYLARPKRI
jgi:hypothetical protein